MDPAGASDRTGGCLRVSEVYLARPGEARDTVGEEGFAGSAERSAHSATEKARTRSRTLRNFPRRPGARRRHDDGRFPTLFSDQS